MKQNKNNILYYVGFSFCLDYPKVTQGLYFLKEQNQNLLSHKLSPRSPTMAFSSVRENVTPTHSWKLCWKMLLLIIFY